ncbi:hypothetical protein [Catenulispora acidiphila]|nr:hypothetical protein [Catenulispora acidiphila]
MPEPVRDVPDVLHAVPDDRRDHHGWDHHRRNHDWWNHHRRNDW